MTLSAGIDYVCRGGQLNTKGGKLNMSHWIRTISLLCSTGLLSLLFTGFIFGMIYCQDCNGNIVTRLFIGFISALATLFTFGHPPLNPGNTPLNIVPHTIVVWLVSFLVIKKMTRRASQKF